MLDSAAGIFGSVMSTFYPDAELYRSTFTGNGKGGGSEAFSAAEPVKAQLDKVIERTVDGNIMKLQSIFLLQRFDRDGAEVIVAKPGTDDEIIAEGVRWQIKIIEQDPAASYFLLGGYEKK